MDILIHDPLEMSMWTGLVEYMVKARDMSNSYESEPSINACERSIYTVHRRVCEKQTSKLHSGKKDHK